MREERSFQVEIPVGTKALRLERAWNIQGDAFSVAGMGVLVENSWEVREDIVYGLKTLEYYSKEVRFCSGDNGGFC